MVHSNQKLLDRELVANDSVNIYTEASFYVDYTD